MLSPDNKPVGVVLSLDRLTSIVSGKSAPPKPKSSKLRGSWLPKPEPPDGSVVGVPPETAPAELASTLLAASL